jgi:hypothetical protein
VTGCPEIQRDAAGLAALAPDDPERRAAEDHARTCPACAEALASGRRLIELLERVPLVEPPAPEALARAAAEIRAELHAGQRRAGLAVAAAIAIGWGFLVGLAPIMSTGWLPIVQTFVVLGLALLGGALASRLGNGLVFGVVAISATAALLGGTGGGTNQVAGQNCVIAELIVAAITLGVAVWAFDRWVGPVSAGTLAGVAALGALAGQAALTLDCPEGSVTPHRIVFHVGGVLLAAVLGLAIAKLRLLRSHPA